MPERSFGRTIRYRRTKLGLSQAKLGELVGRTANTVRSWERDKSAPTEAKVLTALAAILGVDEKHLFEKAGQPLPEVETSPTIEQELASLAPETSPPQENEKAVTTIPVEEDLPDPAGPEPAEQPPVQEIDDAPDPADPTAGDVEGTGPAPSPPISATPLTPPPRTAPPPKAPAREPVAPVIPEPAFTTPPEPFVVTQTMPRPVEPSYIEDSSQRQLYRVRNLATIVILVALGIAFIWALGEGLGALGDWWDEFVGSLRL